MALAWVCSVRCIPVKPASTEHTANSVLLGSCSPVGGNRWNGALPSGAEKCVQMRGPFWQTKLHCLKTRTLTGTGWNQKPGTGGGFCAAGWSAERSSTMKVPSSSSRQVCASTLKRGAHTCGCGCTLNPATAPLTTPLGTKTSKAHQAGNHCCVKCALGQTLQWERARAQQGPFLARTYCSRLPVGRTVHSSVREWASPCSTCTLPINGRSGPRSSSACYPQAPQSALRADSLCTACNASEPQLEALLTGL